MRSAMRSAQEDEQGERQGGRAEVEEEDDMTCAICMCRRRPLLLSGSARLTYDLGEAHL
jgi:hypothetical protein